MNYIWAGLLAIGFLAGILNGRIEEVTNAAFSSAARAVELSIGLLGMMCFWSGMMKIVERSGLINVIAKAAQPILRPLFPGLENNDRAMGAIVMNMSANFMGLGNAATPFGIKAMEELQKLNGGYRNRCHVHVSRTELVGAAVHTDDCACHQERCRLCGSVRGHCVHMGGFDIRCHSRNTRGKSPDAGVEAQVVCRYETRQGNGVETIQW